MVRYAKEHKETTRQRIIESAGQRFKESGLDGSGIAILMADAGLTNGAFYAHFESKNDLVANVVADQLGHQARALGQLPPGRDGLLAFIREYLTPRHRDNPADGCPSAALLDEIVRCDEPTRQAYTHGARAILKEIESRLSPTKPSSARGQAIGLYTLMVGTLQLARAIDDEKLSSQILKHGIENARLFLN